MDVYTFDNVYLGTVLGIHRGTAPAGQPVEGTTERSSEVSGEALGPMPTESLGNAAPTAQAAINRYATAADGASKLGQASLRIGKWRGLVGSRTLPLEAVLNVSLERVVLRVRSVDLE